MIKLRFDPLIEYSRLRVLPMGRSHRLYAAVPAVYSEMVMLWVFNYETPCDNGRPLYLRTTPILNVSETLTNQSICEIS